MKIILAGLLVVTVVSALVRFDMDCSNAPRADDERAGSAGLRTPQFSGALPESLDDLGLFAELAGLEPAANVIAYELRHPFRSDSAQATRHAWIPLKGRIDLDAEGRFLLPDGSILTKTVDLHSEGSTHRIETRVLAKHEGRWQYGAYLWNANRSAAVLSDGRPEDTGLSAPGSDESYVVPGRLTCLRCHAGVADVAIGFDPYQLDDATLLLLEERGQLSVAPEGILQRESPTGEAIGRLPGHDQVAAR